MCGGNSITINVSRIANSTNLSLKQGESKPGTPLDPGNDALITDVDAKQTIKWQLDPHPDSGRNTEITLLHVKAGTTDSNSQQLLEKAEYTAVDGVITGKTMASLPPSKPGQGPGEKAYEKYQIGFYLNSDSTKTEIWDDPRLRRKT